MNCTFGRLSNRGGFVIWVLLASIFSLASESLAGQQNAASIVGQIRDESGAILPGVTVTARSSALQVPEVSTVTDERGEYRLSPLPIGIYSVDYTLSGFQEIRRESIQLTIGFTARLDEIMKIGGVQESVTVAGSSPVVDVSSSASTTKLNRETLEILPTGRSGINDLLAQAPGTRGEYGTGGSNMNTNPSFRAFGQSNEYWSTLEGVVTTPPLTGGPGNFYDYSSMDESVVQTIGNDAEMPRRGVYLASVVKSGGNQLHGSGFGSYTNDTFQSANIDDALRAQGFTTTNKLRKRFDISAQAGGKIIENKLWYFGAWRRRNETTEVPNSFSIVRPPFAPPAGTPDRLSGELYISNTAALQKLLQPSYTGKISYQMSAANRIVGFVQRLEKHRINAPSTFQSPLSPADEQTWTWVAKGEWQHVRNSVVFDVQHGYWDFDVVYPGRTTEPTSSDTVTQAAWGDATSHGNLPYDYRTSTSGTVSWYKPDVLFGNHDLKAGVLWSASDISRIWDNRRTNTGQTPNLTSGNYYLIFRNGAPFQFQALNTPVHPYNQDHYLGIFVKDGWTIRRRLTANLGLRFSRDNGFVPPQCREAGDWPFTPAQCFNKVQLKIFNSFAPRMAASYDVTGDGKTVVKGGWARFDHMREITPEVDNLNPNTFTQTTFTWRDLNGNNNYDPGEVNLDPNGPDFISISGTSAAIPSPNEKQPKVDEFSISIERELVRNMAIRATWIYSRNFNAYRLAGVERPYESYNIPITNPDPGPDGRVGTADDPGTSVTYYEYAAALGGLRNSDTTLVNPGSANDHSYKSYEIAASKRLAENWQFNASYSSTTSNIPFGSLMSVPTAGGNLPGGTLPLTPNAEIFTADYTREWLGKLSGAYIFPKGFLGSVNFEHRSGIPFARQVQFSGGKQIPNIVLNVEPIGTRRLPNLNTLDLRGAKTFNLKQGRKAEARVNIFNALNINGALSVNQRSGATFLRPTSLVLPRVFDLSLSYIF